MKLTDKRFWILMISIITISCNNQSSKLAPETAQSVGNAIFCIQEISKEEYLQANSTANNYNIYPQCIDSIAKQNVLNKIFQDAQKRIAGLDSLYKYAIYEAVTNEELFNMDNLLYYPELKLLGLRIPLDYHNNSMWWYDSTSGKWVDDTNLEPSAINKNGVFVCQVREDCDIHLDLHFFQIDKNGIHKIQIYGNEMYSGEYCMYLTEEYQIEPIFWNKDNTLYLRSYDFVKCKIVYLKVALSELI